MQFADYLEIQNLVYRYAQLADQGDFDGVGQLFAHANFVAPGTGPFNRDPAAVSAVFRQWVRFYPETGTTRTRHVTTNLIVEFDGPSAARSSCGVIVFQGTPELPLQPIVASSYRDRFEKVDGHWRFAERRIALDVPDIMGNLTAHLTSTSHLETAAGK